MIIFKNIKFYLFQGNEIEGEGEEGEREKKRTRPKTRVRVRNLCVCVGTSVGKVRERKKRTEREKERLAMAGELKQGASKSIQACNRDITNTSRGLHYKESEVRELKLLIEPRHPNVECKHVNLLAIGLYVPSQ